MDLYRYYIYNKTIDLNSNQFECFEETNEVCLFISSFGKGEKVKNNDNRN